MAGDLITKAITRLIVFIYGVFTIILYGVLSIKKGSFFKRRTEKQNLELQLARDRLWNLSKDYAGLSHHFLTLPSGFKFHFVSNVTPGSPAALKSDKPLVIFIHGFPDSWAIWRHIASSPSLQDAANVVAIDLPGYGGTQSLERYTATAVLEKLTELIITLRSQYGVDEGSEVNKEKVVIVAHDWGCVLSMRLAAEAPSLAHRFILSNGPLMSLVESNIRRMLTSASKMFKSALSAPLSSRTPLLQALRTLGPLLKQLRMSGYVFTMQLPPSLVTFFLTGGNYSFISAVHRGSHGRAEFTSRDEADSMASSMGPSLAESKTQTANGDKYPTTIKYTHDFANVMNMAGYYRDGASTARWQKSIETITSLHSIAGGNELRRTSSGAGLFDDGTPGVLKANSTVFWGKRDIALNPPICLDGMSDYLVADSQIVMLPESGHFTPIETESRVALVKAVEWAIHGEQGNIGSAIQECYPSAKVIARR
ncbi:uncharacterized protein N7482_008377 [Penicillium canariense]|uniref:AB hydrolase-1 domain-containing protein n=1 Tax=Penicillium canariense TaxID=189055 RepID=A0A9W9HTT6_9EURO|nr:uncharacterized protein N7482_008377 [Penicillium canariense]KAJ5157277.1 hypothetical protein N7482_008377 [Penicillium canariense]